MWISLVVPPAVLVLALLLQRLEAALLDTPGPVVRMDDPHPFPDSRAGAPLALVVPPPEEQPLRAAPAGGRVRPAPVSRATA